MSTKTLMTVEQFAQMKTADTEDYELVEGELIPLASRTPRHAAIRDLLFFLMRTYLMANPIGRAFCEIDCRTIDGTIRRPDVSLFLNERLRLVDLDTVPAPFSPDIAVEVLSPSEPAILVRRKVREYLRSGAQEVWLLDPSNGELEVHSSITGVRILQAGETLETPVLPGFQATLDQLLANA